jgi:hypothetical protein
MKPRVQKAEVTATTKKMVDDGDSNSGSSNQISKPSFDDSSEYSFQTNNSNGSTTTGGTGTSGPTGAGIPEAILATKETRAVYYSRIMVLAVLVISAAVAGGLTFRLSSESEKDDFEVQVSTSYFMLHYLSFVVF